MTGGPYNEAVVDYESVAEGACLKTLAGEDRVEEELAVSPVDVDSVFTPLVSPFEPSDLFGRDRR